MQAFTKVGLEALLTPENCVLLLIDHQPFQLANVNSHEPTMVINNVTALAKTAKAYGIPTILTTVNEERGGVIFKQVQAVFPDQKPINRTFINSWEDRRVVEAIKRRVRFGRVRRNQGSGLGQDRLQTRHQGQVGQALQEARL
jgi:nicotinamidase-related amidase